MRICFVSPTIYPLFNKEIHDLVPGGAEVQLYLLGLYLSREDGVEVEYIVKDHRQPAVEQYGAITLLRDKDRYDHRQPEETSWQTGVRKAKKWWTRILFYIRMTRYRPDVIVMRSASPNVWYVRQMARFFRAKFVYMAAHEIDCTGEYERWAPESARQYRSGMTTADLVVVQNKEQQAALKSTYNKDAIIMPSICEVSEMPSTAPREFILWVGRCEQWKQPELYIELAKRNPSEKFVMIAPPAKDVAYQKSIQSACGALSNMEYIPFVPFDSIDQYFERAKLLVVTSQYEGFPNTLLQAGKYGTPILSLQVNPDSIFQSYKIGLCAGGDRERFFQIFQEMVGTPQHLVEYGVGAVQYVHDHHDARRVVPKYRELFIKLTHL